MCLAFRVPRVPRGIATCSERRLAPFGAVLPLSPSAAPPPCESMVVGAYRSLAMAAFPAHGLPPTVRGTAWQV